MFIFTEAFLCEEILSPLLLSWNKHESEILHVYGRPEIIDSLFEEHNLSNSKFINASLDLPQKIINKTIDYYCHSGHRATAFLWTYLFKNIADREFIHIDSDVILINCATSSFFQNSSTRHQIIGMQRDQAFKALGLLGKGVYKKDEIIKKVFNSVDTSFFYLDAQRIKLIPKFVLIRLIESSGLYGWRFFFGDGARDFFDPVFCLYRLLGLNFINIDKSYFLESKVLTFSSGIGTGCRIYNSGLNYNNLNAYETHALRNYYIYSKFILNSDIHIPEKFKPSTEELTRIKLLDTKNWSLYN